MANSAVGRRVVRNVLTQHDTIKSLWRGQSSKGRIVFVTRRLANSSESIGRVVEIRPVYVIVEYRSI